MFELVLLVLFVLVPCSVFRVALTPGPSPQGRGGKRLVRWEFRHWGKLTTNH